MIYFEVPADKTHKICVRSLTDMIHYQFKKLWQVEEDAEDDGGDHVLHHAAPGTGGCRHDCLKINFPIQPILNLTKLDQFSFFSKMV